MSGPYDILAVGYACIDYIAAIDRLPNLDEKLMVDDLVIQGGGLSATAMVCAARLGARTGLVAALAKDPLGRQIVSELDEEHVDSSVSPIYSEGRSAWAFCMIQRGTGLRTIIGRRPVLPQLTGENVPMEEVRRAKVVFIDSTEPVAQLAAAKAAYKAGVPVVMDADNATEGTDELVLNTDVLIASREFGRAVGGSDDPAEAAKSLLSKGHVKIAAVTAGIEGAYFHSAEGAFHQPAFKVDVVDTTGAGDAFHGAYAYTMVRNWPIRKSAEFAAAVAAMKCTKIGGRTGLPTLAQVEEFIRQRSGGR